MACCQVKTGNLKFAFFLFLRNFLVLYFLFLFFNHKFLLISYTFLFLKLLSSSHLRKITCFNNLFSFSHQKKCCFFMKWNGLELKWEKNVRENGKTTVWCLVNGLWNKFFFSSVQLFTLCWCKCKWMEFLVIRVFEELMFVVSGCVRFIFHASNVIWVFWIMYMFYLRNTLTWAS